MRISFWHFLLLLALLVAGYYGYTKWWAYQSRNQWVGGLHSAALQSDEELKQGKKAKPLGSDTSTAPDTKAPPPPARDANGWIID